MRNGERLKRRGQRLGREEKRRGAKNKEMKGGEEETYNKNVPRASFHALPQYTVGPKYTGFLVATLVLVEAKRRDMGSWKGFRVRRVASVRDIVFGG
jgi:hypothetical protein